MALTVTQASVIPKLTVSTERNAYNDKITLVAQVPVKDKDVLFNTDWSTNYYYYYGYNYYNYDTVAFFRGNTQIGSAEVINGIAKIDVFSNTGLDSDDLTAVYQIHNNHAAGVSAPVKLTTNPQGDSAVSLTASSVTSAAGTAVTLNANNTNSYQSGLGYWVQGGTYSFYNGDVLLGSVPQNYWGASLVVNNLPLGENQLRVVYSGNPDGHAATSVSSIFTHTVTKPNATVAGSVVPINDNGDEVLGYAVDAKFIRITAKVAGTPPPAIAPAPTGTIVITNSATGERYATLPLVDGQGRVDIAV